VTIFLIASSAIGYWLLAIGLQTYSISENALFCLFWISDDLKRWTARTTHAFHAQAWISMRRMLTLVASANGMAGSWGLLR
jgi:hypothetical protein